MATMKSDKFEQKEKTVKKTQRNVTRPHKHRHIHIWIQSSEKKKRHLLTGR